MSAWLRSIGTASDRLAPTAEEIEWARQSLLAALAAERLARRWRRCTGWRTGGRAQPRTSAPAEATSARRDPEAIDASPDDGRSARKHFIATLHAERDRWASAAAEPDAGLIC
ncbi:MAG: hypothetical protein WC273_07685 [Dehalococcoidia bacterium]